MIKVETPELSTASKYVLSKIQKLIDENELSNGSTLTVPCYEYKTVVHGPDPEDFHSESDQINVKNDKSIRRLISYFEDSGAIDVTALVELPYVNYNITLPEKYLYVHSIGIIIKDVDLIESFGTDSAKFAPKVSTKIGKDFTIRSGNLIYYKDQLVELQPQISKISAMIMKRASHGAFTPTSDIIDECFSEDYLEKSGASGNESLVYKNLRRAISSARASFRTATGSSKDKDYFPNRSGVGYTFEE